LKANQNVPVEYLRLAKLLVEQLAGLPHFQQLCFLALLDLPPRRSVA
jgi:hypothetical protein